MSTKILYPQASFQQGCARRGGGGGEGGRGMEDKGLGTLGRPDLKERAEQRPGPQPD